MKTKKMIMSYFIMSMGLLLCSCGNEMQTSNNIEKTDSAKASENSEYTGDLADIGDSFVLKNANLIDGTGAAEKANSCIVIENGIFKEVGAENEVHIPADAKIIDLKGASVLPGWINTHVHQGYDDTNLKNWIEAGVTTVRVESPGLVQNFLSERDRINKNADRPFVISATPILKVEGGYGYGNAVVTSPENAKDTVLDYIDNGVDVIKFSLEDHLQNCVLMPDDYVKSIVDAAHSRNKKVSVHISRQKNLKVAIDAGVDDIAHMVVDTLDSDTINAIIAKNIYIVPTLELWKGVGWGSGAISNLSAFYQAGGKIAFGTDFAGYSIAFDKGFPITEVQLMKDAGMSTMDIIISATKNAAYVCGLDKELGTVEVGKKADLLIVDGDPLEDVNALAKTKMVIHEGKIIK